LSLDHNPWIPNQIHQSPVFIDHFPIIFVNPIVNHPQFTLKFLGSFLAINPFLGVYDIAFRTG
jgi:hypothetical protein